jgi:hypothetical protein
VLIHINPQVFDLLRNRIHSSSYLKLGWFAVRNRGPDEISSEATFEERDRKEMELFESGKWKEATSDPSHFSSIDPTVLGIKRLKLALQKTLYKRVKENFPLLKAKMKGLKKENEGQLKRMGDSRDNPKDQRVYLSEIQSLYEREVSRSLNGDYRWPKDPSHVSHLRYHIEGFNEEFEKDIENKGHTYDWQLHKDQDAKEDPNQLEGVPKSGIFAWILQTWDYMIGSEVKGDIPPNLKKKLFEEQTETWEVRSKSYLEKVVRAIRKCNEDLFKEACKDHALRMKIQDLLEPLETKAFEAAEAELQNILGDLHYLNSCHPGVLIDTQAFQLARATRQAEKDSQPTGSGNQGIPADRVERQASSLSAFALNNKRVYEIHDWLFAFWKVAFPRFVDNIIIQVVERHLLGNKGPFRLFNRAWIDCLDEVDLKSLAGEDEATINERKVINEKLEGLNEALERAEVALR